MAADSSMGFHQGITASMYNHHMLSFQSNSDLGGGAGAAAGMVMAPRSMNGSSSSAGLYVREPNIMKYIKIAAMLPNRTVRDVALRCWWATSKDRRKKPDGFYTGKKIRDMKPIQDKMVASASMANFHLAPANTVTPFSISMQHTNQQCQVPKEEVPVVDSATQHLLEENNHLLNQIATNIETFKMGENTDLFFRTNNNFKSILSRMSETPGIMGQMPQLPVQVNEDHLSSLLQLDRMVRAHDPFLRMA
uniref:Uncharacterized protein n=1 Tax=Oryza meridionalis TaxID=40149 RepID=A0A0E0DK17_9ORYZ